MDENKNGFYGEENNQMSDVNSQQNFGPEGYQQQPQQNYNQGYQQPNQYGQGVPPQQQQQYNPNYQQPNPYQQPNGYNQNPYYQQPIPVMVHNTAQNAKTALTMALIGLLGICFPIIGWILGGMALSKAKTAYNTEAHSTAKTATTVAITVIIISSINAIAGAIMFISNM